MSGTVGDIRLGSGDLYLNGVRVGFLSGDVLLAYERSGFTLSPAGSASQNLVAIGKASLKAALAELSMEHLRLALGLGGSISTSTGAASYNPASFSWTSSTSWEGLKFGRDSLDTSTVPLLFEHTKTDGKKVAVMLYQAVTPSKLVLPFADRNVTVYDVEFVGVPDESRSRGDQIGILIEEV